MALNIIASNSGGSSRRNSSKSRGGTFKSAPKKAPLRGAAASNAKKQLTQGRIPSSAPKTSTATRTQGTSVGTWNPSNYSSSDGGYSAPAAPVAPAVPSEADYLAGDATYQATLAALKKQLQNFTTDVDTQRSNRKLDYDKSLQDLGYIAPNPNARGGGPSWNWEDTLTASGRANQNQLNDFAARGMLQSSGYADSLQDLTRSLTDQYTGIDQANTQFNTDLDRQVTRAKDENTSASQAARAEAIMRRAAQYGFGV